jgi:DNA-directed RNA polymerase specialized sigma24 family protein
MMTEQEYTNTYTDQYKQMLAFAKSILGKEYASDAEDVVQDVFLDLWRKRDTVLKPIEWVKEAIKHEAYKVRELGQRYDLWGMPIALEKVAK